MIFGSLAGNQNRKRRERHEQRRSIWEVKWGFQGRIRRWGDHRDGCDDGGRYWGLGFSGAHQSAGGCGAGVWHEVQYGPGGVHEERRRNGGYHHQPDRIKRLWRIDWSAECRDFISVWRNSTAGRKRSWCGVSFRCSYSVWCWGWGRSLPVSIWWMTGSLPSMWTGWHWKAEALRTACGKRWATIWPCGFGRCIISTACWWRRCLALIWQQCQ